MLIFSSFDEYYAAGLLLELPECLSFGTYYHSNKVHILVLWQKQSILSFLAVKQEFRHTGIHTGRPMIVKGARVPLEVRALS